jgi:hypothetical protein
LDFLRFCEAISPDQSPKWTPRQKKLDAFDRALYGELYKHKTIPFSQEVQDPHNTRSETILLDERRASVQYRLPLMLVRDVVGRLWGEAHRPTVVARGDKNTAAWLQAFVRDTTFWLTLIEASWAGASGSTCIVLRVLGDAEDVEIDGKKISRPKGPGRFFAEVWPTKECSPVFDRNRPGELLSLERVQTISVDTLRADGYPIDALEKKWENKKLGRSGDQQASARATLVSDKWALRLVLDRKAETWYEPIPLWLYNRDDFQKSEWIKDRNRTFDHELNETPARWARPIPFPAATFPDGLSLFEPVIDFQFRIDRTLSQTGRALDYVGDPQLSVKAGDESGNGEFGSDDGAEIAGATGIITGDAKYVEITGEGLRVAIEHYCKQLIRLAREVGGGSRIDEDQNVGAMSGTAMRLMNAALDVLAGILRITLGEKLFVDLLRLAMRMSAAVNVELPSLPAILAQQGEGATGKPDPAALLDLTWPDAYAPMGQDLLFQVQAVELAASATNGPPLISFATAVATLASLFGTQDPKQEEADIIADTQLRAQLSPTEAAAPEDPRDAGKGSKTNDNDNSDSS